jgi:Uma2 family endonuclease
MQSAGRDVLFFFVLSSLTSNLGYYHPDLVVTCDDRDRNSKSNFLKHPCLIIEVLSPSTAPFNRTEKFADYRTISSLSEYVLVSTDRQQLDHFQRDDRGN